VAMVICYAKYRYKGSKAVGFYIGRKDHATVMHAIKTIKNLRDTDKNFAKDFYIIEAKYEMIKTDESTGYSSVLYFFLKLKKTIEQKIIKNALNNQYYGSVQNN
jgi:hypothetical protein